MDPHTANERLRRFYDRSAAGYDRWMRHYDRAMLGDGISRQPASSSSVATVPGGASSR